MNRTENDFGEETELQKLLNFYEEEVLQNPWHRHDLDQQCSSDNELLDQSVFSSSTGQDSSGSQATHRSGPGASPLSSLTFIPTHSDPAALTPTDARTYSDISTPNISSPDIHDEDHRSSHDDTSSHPRHVRIKEEGPSKHRKDKGGDDTEGKGSSSGGPKTQAVERRRRDSHNEFERRRRDAINTKLTELKRLVPSLNNLVSNKATVLSKAIDYIAQMAKENTRASHHIRQLSTENTKAVEIISQLNDENSELRSQIEVLRLGLGQKDMPMHPLTPTSPSFSLSKRPRRDITPQINVPAPPITPPVVATCVPDEVLKQFVASSLALTTRSLVVADGTHPNMPLIYASLGFQLMTGYAQEEIIGRNCSFLQGRNTSPLTRNVIRNALREKQEVLVEILNYKKDGTPFWNLLFITPILDLHGNATYYLGMQFDITDVKCTKETVLKNEYNVHNPRAEASPSDPSVLYVPNETLKHLIASALRLIMRNIVVTDPKQSGNPIVYCTPGISQMTQYSKDEILGRNAGFLQGPSSDPVTKSQIGNALRESRECLAEMLNYKKDGTPFWNLMFITPIIDAFSKPNLFIGVEYDITLA
mmetsp:Transcript_4495/g.6949  ORF Transcript_4495/g.6949 Transcript_4495/m.6949 type:complete len:591 (+) Transcript_4495:140-1912(+)